MSNFLLGVLGSLIGAATTALVGFKIWQQQQRHEARLRLLKETCTDFAELCRITAGDTENMSDVADCIMRLQSNAVLAEVVYDEQIATIFRETMETLGGEEVAVEQRRALVRLLGAMARKIK